jgi:hypothetical protein
VKRPKSAARTRIKSIVSAHCIRKKSFCKRSSKLKRFAQTFVMRSNATELLTGCSQKEKEDLEEVSSELELADEDEKVS